VSEVDLMVESAKAAYEIDKAYRRGDMAFVRQRLGTAGARAFARMKRDSSIVYGTIERQLMAAHQATA
jgi:hypothetical protein